MDFQSKQWYNGGFREDELKLLEIFLSTRVQNKVKTYADEKAHDTVEEIKKLSLTAKDKIEVHIEFIIPFTVKEAVDELRKHYGTLR